MATDGNDHIFGDLGNDWLVGGTGRDSLWGGWGDDYLNADDVLNTGGLSTNIGTDTNASYEDSAFGGAGRDVLQANTGGDRLMDWIGEYNSFLTPFAPFGMATVSRTVQPQLPEYLWALSKSEGADMTLAAKYSSDPARNGEPFGELGQIDQKDAAWGDQHGAPRDPQAGNTPGGKRDVLRTSGTKFLDAAPAVTGGAAAAIAFAGVAFLAPAVSTAKKAGQAKATLAFYGPVGANAHWTIGDGVKSVSGDATVGADGSVTVEIDVSTLADGVLLGSVLETDILGNTAAGPSITWLKDTAAASGGFQVNGATPINGIVATNNRFLSLSLNYFDATSGVSAMAFSTDGGMTWTPVESYGSFGAVALPAVDGLYNVAVRIVDLAGNITLATQQVRLDTTGPAIADPYLNGLIYDVGQTITLSFAVSDVDNVGWISSSLDGTTIASKLISSQIVISISVDGLAAGNHVLIVTAKDSLGNMSSVTVTFQVHATAQGLVNAFNDGVAQGKITGNQVNTLNKLQAAVAAMQRGDRASAKTALITFINQVQSQLGRGIDTTYGNRLIAWANDLLSRI